jgi:RNA polymerase sigma factor (sigma-70 family)
MSGSELNNLSDTHLIELLIHQNELVTRHFFYQKCSPMFSYIIKNIFHYQAQRNELVNELYIYLSANNWEKVKQFNYESKFTTWLSVVATRYFIKKRNDLIEYEYRKAPIEEVDNFYNTNIVAPLVRNYDLFNAIQKLRNPRDRFVIMALEIEEKTVQEVANELNVTVDNLYNIRKRAKKHLSNILTAYKYEN